MCSLTFKSGHSVISQDGLEKQKEPNSKTGSKSSDREKVTHCVINSFVEKEMSQDWKVKYRMFPFKFGKAFAYYLSVPVDLSQACVERSFQMSNTSVSVNGSIYMMTYVLQNHVWYASATY